MSRQMYNVLCYSCGYSVREEEEGQARQAKERHIADPANHGHEVYVDLVVLDDEEVYT